MSSQIVVIPAKAGIQELVSIWNNEFPLPNRADDKLLGNGKHWCHKNVSLLT